MADEFHQHGVAFLAPQAAENTARWFGLGDTASMAVIRKGAILAIEQECSSEAFERLIEVDVLEEVRKRREVSLKTRGRNIASESINEK